MENDLKKIKELADLRLTAEEKASSRAVVWRFMENGRTQQRHQPIWSRVSLLIMVLLLLGSGVALAAENALPGETLFPVKLIVNDQVRSALAGSTEARVRLDAKLAQRRLEEAERVAAQGKFSDKAKAQVEANFTAHAQAVDQGIGQLNKQGRVGIAADVSSDLESALRAHDAILTALNKKHQAKPASDPLVNKVRGHWQTAKEARLATENKLINVDSALERESKRIDRETKLLERAESEFKIKVEAVDGIEPKRLLR